MTRLGRRMAEVECFRLILKDAIEGEFRTLRGMAFQMDGAEQRKAREPNLVLDAGRFRSRA